jgi:hypothetical protein
MYASKIVGCRAFQPESLAEEPETAITADAFSEIIPSRDQLRFAELIARRQDDRSKVSEPLYAFEKADPRPPEADSG